MGQGPVQGPREEVQGPRARATKRSARASGFSKTLNHACTSNCGPCTELHCLSLVALAHIRGPCTSFCGPCTYPSGPCTHFYSADLWPLHMALAPLLVALAQALAPRKLLLFGRLSGSGSIKTLEVFGSTKTHEVSRGEAHQNT